MVNLAVIRKWVDALRSGEYEQGRAYLNRDGKFCCLGVLCELAVAEGVTEKTTAVHDKSVVQYGHQEPRPGDDPGNPAGEGWWWTGTLPPEVRDWIGQEAVEQDGLSPGDVMLTDGLRAAAANDVGGYNFEQIADLLEQRYLAVEKV